jgi:hypothetical protein
MSDTVSKRLLYSLIFNLGNTVILEIKAGSSLAFSHSLRHFYPLFAFDHLSKVGGTNFVTMLRFSVVGSWIVWRQSL